MATSTFDLRVRQQCEAARAEGQRRSYGTVATNLGLQADNWQHLQIVIGALKRNMRQDHRRGRPISAVAACRADTHLPGWGYITLGHELGRYSGGDPEAFIEAEWQRFCAAA